jgi:hypothetical protein
MVVGHGGNRWHMWKGQVMWSRGGRVPAKPARTPILDLHGTLILGGPLVVLETTRGGHEMHHRCHMSQTKNQRVSIWTPPFVNG